MIDFNKALKKCPFCGGQAHLHKAFNGFGYIGYYVHCHDCGAGSRVSAPSNCYAKYNPDNKEMTFSITYDDMDIATQLINRWNKREND